jgi:hypothetical protein
MTCISVTDVNFEKQNKNNSWKLSVYNVLTWDNIFYKTIVINVKTGYKPWLSWIIS